MNKFIYKIVIYDAFGTIIIINKKNRYIYSYNKISGIEQGIIKSLL